MEESVWGEGRGSMEEGGKGWSKVREGEVAGSRYS